MYAREMYRSCVFQFSECSNWKSRFLELFGICRWELLRLGCLFFFGFWSKQFGSSALQSPFGARPMHSKPLPAGTGGHRIFDG